MYIIFEQNMSVLFYYFYLGYEQRAKDLISSNYDNGNESKTK